MANKIIAVDFDGCLVANAYPDIGDVIPEALDDLLLEQRAGAKIILWTCRRGEALAAPTGRGVRDGKPVPCGGGIDSSLRSE